MSYCVMGPRGRGVGQITLAIQPAIAAATGGATGAGAGAWGIAAAGGPVGLAIAGAFTAATILFSRARQRGAQKEAATRVVDEVEPLLAQARDAFLSDPTVENQQKGLAFFDYVWSEVLAGCGQAALGDAGRRCISERSRGGVWDWFALYRDPIERWQPTGVLSIFGGGRTAGFLDSPAFLIASVAVMAGAVAYFMEE